MADFLQAHNIDMIFCLGGDGTQRGAHAPPVTTFVACRPMSTTGSCAITWRDMQCMPRWLERQAP